MSSALILDSDPDGHGSTVQSYFDTDSPSDWTSEILETFNDEPSIEDGVDYAINNSFDILLDPL